MERSRRVAGHLTEEFVMIDAGPSGDDVTALQATDPAVAAAVAALVRPYVQGLYLLIELLRTGPTPADGRHLTGRYRAAAARLVETVLLGLLWILISHGLLPFWMAGLVLFPRVSLHMVGHSFVQ